MSHTPDLEPPYGPPWARRPLFVLPSAERESGSRRLVPARGVRASILPGPRVCKKEDSLQSDGLLEDHPVGLPLEG